MRFQGKLQNQIWDNGKKLVLGLILAHLVPPKNFFKNLAPSVTRYHVQLSSCTTSEKTNDPVLRKLRDRQTEGQTEESDFIRLCLPNVERPKALKESQSDTSNSVLLDHQILENNPTITIDKMNSKHIYSIIISSKVNVPRSGIYFEQRFPLYNFQWKDIYTL